MKKRIKNFAPLRGVGRFLMRWYVYSSFSRKRGGNKPLMGMNARITMKIEEWVSGGGFLAPDTGLKETAAGFGVSADQLSAYCRNIIGKPFRSWRKELRIRESMRLLLERPELSTRDVAELVGVMDKSDFRRQFTEICGCSPAEWRRKAGK